MERKDLEEIQKALKEFILNSTKKGAPSFAVQTLPDAIGKYLEIEHKLMLRKQL